MLCKTYSYQGGLGKKTPTRASPPQEMRASTAPTRASSPHELRGLGVRLDRTDRFGASVYFKFRFLDFPDRTVLQEINNRAFGSPIIRFGLRVQPNGSEIGGK